jgi:DNA repair protein RadC
MAISTTQKRKRIKDLPLSDRPREKLFQKGAQNLSDAELLGLLLGTGTKKQNAVKLAELLLKEIPLQKLATLPQEKLQETSGIGIGKAARILAALELGQRIFSPVSLQKVILRTYEQILAECRDLAEKNQEQLLALYVNARYELIQKEIIALGSVNALRIEPKEIFAPALLTPCTTIILAHNHPSKNPSPSEDDIQFTRRVQEAGELLGVHLFDHLIITSTTYFSFRDNTTRLAYS